MAWMQSDAGLRLGGLGGLFPLTFY